MPLIKHLRTLGYAIRTKLYGAGLLAAKYPLRMNIDLIMFYVIKGYKKGIKLDPHIGSVSALEKLGFTFQRQEVADGKQNRIGRNDPSGAGV